MRKKNENAAFFRYSRSALRLLPFLLVFLNVIFGILGYESRELLLGSLLGAGIANLNLFILAAAILSLGNPGALSKLQSVTYYVFRLLLYAVGLYASVRIGKAALIGFGCGVLLIVPEIIFAEIRKQRQENK
ncbi:MAG: hypothetical protein PUC44_03660 [Eubacteriales bacterium]|nr:hypothetical protein [Eubacteriales bacterium]